MVLGADHLSKELVEETLSVIIKYDRDAEKALADLAAGQARAPPLTSCPWTGF